MTFSETVVQYHSHYYSIDTIDPSCSDFPSFTFMCVYLVLCNFITYIGQVWTTVKILNCCNTTVIPLAALLLPHLLPSHPTSLRKYFPQPTFQPKPLATADVFSLSLNFLLSRILYKIYKYTAKPFVIVFFHAA